MGLLALAAGAGFDLARAGPGEGLAPAEAEVEAEADEVCALAIWRLIAASAAAPPALTFALAWLAAAAGVAGAAAVAQGCSDGNRWAGQNWCLHF